MLNKILFASVLTASMAAAQVSVAPDAGSAARKAIEVFERSAPRGAAVTASLDRAAKPESFEIRASNAGVSVAGGDSAGLAYGIFELLGQVQSGGGPKSVKRTPAVRKRGMTVFLYNRELESAWLYDEEYWKRYFELMARARLNYFTLVFGHQTSYLAPPFPFLIDVPGYERVRAPSFTAADRARNLAMLRRISEMADEWGIRFVFGIWQQHAHLYGKNLVEELSYADLFDYCPKALALILKACPKIHGVQFRMNIESGIEEDDQNRFYTGMAKAIRSVGRPVEVDFRAKGLRPETVESAQALGIRPIVSTKYWREHMGLPFHGTRIDAPDKARSYRRYGYWDLLPRDRAYDVAYRMWTLGSVKLLPWGSLDYARQFARSSLFGGSVGFEVCAPLSQKGFGNWAGGNWRIFAKPELEYYRWEFERYWAYFLSFGLAAYAPEEPRQPVLEAEFRKRFGGAAEAMREAYESASWIVPFVTATRAVSNSNFGYWPEMETGGLTDRYVTLGSGDDNRFYRIDEYVDDLLARRFSAKASPEEIAARLDGWARGTADAMRRAGTDAGNREAAAMRVDFGVLAGLARYHAARMRSGVHYEMFSRTGDRWQLRRAIELFADAVREWKSIAGLTDGVYYANMVFNRPPDQIGHWKDELPFLEHELARLRGIDAMYEEAAAKPEAAIKWTSAMPRYKLAMKWKEENGTLHRWMDPAPVAEAADAAIERYSVRDPRAVWRDAMTRLRYRRILHAPVRHAAEGREIEVRASLAGPRAGARLTLFHRAAGGDFRFRKAEMKEESSNVYAAKLPAMRSPEKLLYYLRADAETALFDGSDKEPHELWIRPADGDRPGIEPAAPAPARVGADVRIAARVRARRKLAAVRLHYRHVDQSEDWRVVNMTPAGAAGEFAAAIPGEFVVPGWDLMYAVEAVDEAGVGAFYPDERRGDPAVTVEVRGGR